MLAPKLKKRIWLQLWGLNLGFIPLNSGKVKVTIRDPPRWVIQLSYQATWGVKMMGSWSVKRSNLLWQWLTGSLLKWSVWKYPILTHLWSQKTVSRIFGPRHVFGIEELTLKYFERFKQTGSSQRISNFKADRIADDATSLFLREGLVAQTFWEPLLKRK